MEEINTLIQEFKTQALIHPNISHLWINYLEKKKEKLNQLLNQGKSVLDQLQLLNDDDDVKDIELKDLMNVLLVKMMFLQ
jgi:hypothetical protein